MVELHRDRVSINKIYVFAGVGAGVVDADYRGELGVILFNFGDTDFQINMGDKVAQLVLEKNQNSCNKRSG